MAAKKSPRPKGWWKEPETLAILTGPLDGPSAARRLGVDTAYLNWLRLQARKAGHEMPPRTPGPRPSVMRVDVFRDDE